VEPVRMGRDDAAAPSRVQVRFSDDEILEGDAVALDLDRPDFELVLADPDANSRRALIPLPSVKFVTFARRPVQAHQPESMQKVALHFNDGEVITGLLSETPRRGRYGVELELVNREGDAVELLGIPYDSLKALFYLQSWEGPHVEPAEGENRHSIATPLVDLLGELRELAEQRDRAAIDDLEFVKRRRAVLDRM
jgi:hypothetical protein